MAYLALIVVLALIGHILTWAISRRITKWQLINYLDKFRSVGKLSEKDFDILKDRYTSITWFLESFPNPEGYPHIYEDVGFSDFVRKRKARHQYLLIMVIVLNVLVISIISVNNYLHS